jgi:transposase
MSEKSPKSFEPVSSAKPSEVLKAPRVKRTFTAQFKEEALAMLSQQGLSVAEAARRLGVHQNLLRKWRNMAQVAGSKAFPGPAQPTAIEEENRQLREENARLKMERDILKKATVFFAKESR